MKKELIKISVIFLVTVGAVVFGLNYLFLSGNSIKSRAAGETMNISYNPASVTTAAASDFTVSVFIKPSVDTFLRGYKGKINFDKNILTFKSIEYKLGTASAGLGATSTDAAAINAAASGQINFMGEIQTSTDYPLTAAQGAELATVTFTAKSTASTSVTISDGGFYSVNSDRSIFADWTVASPSLSINGGGLTPTPTGTAGCLATDKVCLDLKLKFQGITAKPADAQNSMNVKLKLQKQGSTESTEVNGKFTADDKGIWSGKVGFGANPPLGSYFLLIKGPIHLQKKVCDSVPTETSAATYRCGEGKINLVAGQNNLDFSGILLLGGDLDQNGTIDSSDISFIRNNLNKNDAETLKKCDINLDAKCDTQDYSAIIFALSVKVDEM